MNNIEKSEYKTEQNNMKCVLITGGSRGIGAACVKKFSRSGYRVAFIYNRSDCEADALSAEYGALAIKADISDSLKASEAVKKANELLGCIEILINNAGVSSFSLFDEISDTEWRRILGTNLDGTFFVTREAAKIMIRQKYGRIINIGSVWGRCGSSCEVHYSASKAGIRGMTMALAKELGPSGITVNCVEPGVIDTEMNAALGRETVKELADCTPLNRIGKPEDIADAVFFLAGDNASFITGQCLGVDGGFSL